MPQRANKRHEHGPADNVDDDLDRSARFATDGLFQVRLRAIDDGIATGLEQRVALKPTPPR